MKITEHFKTITEDVERYYGVAGVARKKGLDPVEEVETSIAISLAEKAVSLISVLYPQLKDKKIVNRILELEKEYGQLNICVPLKISEEIAKEKFCKFESLLQAIEAGARVAFAYFTLGVVSSPLEGFTGLKLGKTKDGREHFIAYFSGPIRSAGTTAGCVSLMVIDYLRELFGFAKYDPDENEVKRYVTENYDYHERVTNLQYLPTEEEIIFLARNLPIQIAGEPTEQIEVSNYKDLPRVETNFIRGGMCLIFSEGLAQKAAKGYGLLKGAKENGFKTTGWDFLEEYIRDIHSKRGKGESDDSPTYIKDIVAGRPVFSHPSSSGGFRVRYGRSRVNGFSAMSVHPATMAISDSFISVGTQLKIEKPTKGCCVSATGGIDGPIVKLKNGSVKKLEGLNEARELYKNVEEIIYLGDILVPFSDVKNRFYDLMKPGYVEEWWALELEKKSNGLKKREEIDEYNISFEEALGISGDYGVALHPSFIYYWSQISYEQFLGLVDWLARGKMSDGFVLPYGKSDKERFGKGKRCLELLGCEHEVTIENVVINRKDAEALLFNLGVRSEGGKDVESEVDGVIKKIGEIKSGCEGNVLKIVDNLCEFEVKDKAGTFMGARMGRPEKAKLRKLTGSPHVLFPVGSEGGRLRSVQAAVEAGSVKAEFPNFFCPGCGFESVYPVCENCGENCKKKYYCFKCDRYYDGKCPDHGIGADFKEKRIDIRDYFDRAKRMVGARIEELPSAVKGVRGTSNEDHSCENLAKGLLRAKYNLHVNKDGTIRYDMTEMPITHFKPKEIGTSIEKLRGLGYEKDIHGKKLEDENQILEIFPHDIILPSCPDSPDEKAEDVFSRVCGFVDEELEKFYNLPRFFNVKTKEDLIGVLFACIAPHICTATVGRLIGFSKTQPLFASPFMHAAMRRDCDGDEAAVMLLMDLLLNFSRKFLPAHRGGTQDSPLVLNTRINAGEVDDQILDFEVEKYPLELYEFAEQGRHSSEVKIETVGKRMKEGRDPFSNICFTHPSDDFNHAVLNSSYKLLPTMTEKVKAQMLLCGKIRAVDSSDVARLVIERHFIRDIKGNFRKFSMQVFRCVGCNEKYRRPPLKGRCLKCGGKLIFTISEGSIMKYMQGALDLAIGFGVSPYLLECLEIVQKDIESIFGKEKEKQESLGQWF